MIGLETELAVGDPYPAPPPGGGGAGPAPFRVHVSDEVLQDLHRRLGDTRWPDSIPGSGWEHGTDVDYLRSLAAEWAGRFDWRAQEDLLAACLPSWQVALDGLSVHYDRLEGKGPDPFPLVLLHGWPGSYFEMYKIAPALADPAAHGGRAEDAFHVVVPSLPGHGFSGIPPVTGFGADECADVVRQLMVDVLGFARFGAQGGDRGAFVANGLGHRHRDAVAGIHLNFAGGIVGEGDELTDAERRWLADREQWLQTEGGYIAIQGTRPQSLSFGLNDSPAGLLAWIVDKWRAWSDCAGDVERCFTRAELLTNATLYWVTGTIRSSMHYYWEHRVRPPVAVRPQRVDVPTAVAVFPREVLPPPRSAAARKYDLRRWTEFPRGGHFAAMEQPDALVEDIRAFFRDFR